MEHFSAGWLSLREPADHAARSIDLTRAVIEAVPAGRQLRILDLAAGTGSNLRYLTAAGLRGSRSADFLLVDHDPVLLARVPKTSGVTTRRMDLSTLDNRTIFDGRTLVTASALLDLVSDTWLRALAVRCAENGAAALFALSYDGRIVCSPEDRDDGAIVARVNQHQRFDKGFGPALGPDATDCAERCFRDVGYQVTRARSDWLLTSASAELQRQLIDGWAAAAAEIARFEADVIEAWRRRRQAHVDEGLSHIVVGHEDLAAWLLEKNR
jgi:hypothetical protein